MFSALRKSPIDDMAINAVKNNADDVARLAVNNMPSTGSTLQKVLSNADDISEVIDFMPLDKRYARTLDPSGGTNYFGVHSYEPPYFDFEDNVTYPGELFGVGNGGVTSPNNIHGFPDNVPFEDLVTEISSDHNLYNIRPHKNTALGKYYQKQLNSKPHLTSSEFVNNYKAQMHDKSETRELLNLFPERYANAPTELDLANAPLSEEPVNFKLDSTPDYDSMIIDPRDYGQDPALIDSVDYPDGFRNPEDFARYYDDLALGYRTSPSSMVDGHKVQFTEHPYYGIIIDGKRYQYPPSAAAMDAEGFTRSEMLYALPKQDMAKFDMLNKYDNQARRNYYGLKNTVPYKNGIIPLDNTVYSSDDSWRPHMNEALAKFYRKNGRLPNGLNSTGFNDLWFHNMLPFN